MRKHFRFTRKFEVTFLLSQRSHVKFCGQVDASKINNFTKEKNKFSKGIFLFSFDKIYFFF